MKLAIALTNVALILVGVHLFLCLTLFYNSLIEPGALFILLIILRSVFEFVDYIMECVKHETF